MRFIKLFLYTVLVTAFAFVFFFIGFRTGKGTDDPLPVVTRAVNPDPQTELLAEAYRKIRDNYVVKVDAKKLDDGAIAGMIDALSQSYGDGFSAYFPPVQHEQFQEMMNGSFFGIGIVIGLEKGKVTVISPMKGTPAARAGLQSGDHIATIDGRSTKGMKLDRAVSLIKGPKGTKVVIGILRKGLTKPRQYGIIRDEIKYPDMESRLIGKDIGYIQLATFDDKAGRSTRLAVRTLTAKGAKGIILDLRDNGGGLLNQAVSVASVFINDGTIVSIVERNGKSEELKAFGDADTSMPLVLLVNKGSASASEIVAGAIKDRKRGLVVGQKTYGKGSVQTDFSLSNGGGLKITTAHYRTPAGHFIDRERGISPNYLVTPGRPTGHNFAGHFIRYRDDRQLAKAVLVLRSLL